ncbi:hypothetical protein EDD21DRAFT_419388, partial [Dissophora ornata]
EGALALSEALKTNTTLTTLSLQDNSIEKEGALALSEALKTNTTLTTLDLRNNSIESEGALALTNVSKTSGFIVVSSCSGKICSCTGAASIILGLSFELTLQSL